MNKKEKLYILKKCTLCFQKAIMTQYTDTITYLKYKGAGQALKQIIEELIDCQSKPYYEMYINIVRFSNHIDNIGDKNNK